MSKVELVKIENVEVSGWQTALRGMRNPLESWHKSDTEFFSDTNGEENVDNKDVIIIRPDIGPNDYDLCRRLITAGSDHRKFLRQINIGVDISMAWGIWKEYATYKIGTVENSTSQMHKLGSRALTKDDFAMDAWDEDSEKVLEIVNQRITKWKALKETSDNPEEIKQAWRDMLHLIPSTFIYKRTCTLNYEVLMNMYNARKTHKQKEWHMLLNGLLDVIPYPEFITKEFK